MWKGLMDTWPYGRSVAWSRRVGASLCFSFVVIGSSMFRGVGETDDCVSRRAKGRSGDPTSVKTEKTSRGSKRCNIRASFLNDVVQTRSPARGSARRDGVPSPDDAGGDRRARGRV